MEGGQFPYYPNPNHFNSAAGGTQNDQQSNNQQQQQQIVGNTADFPLLEHGYAYPAGPQYADLGIPTAAAGQFNENDGNFHSAVGNGNNNPAFQQHQQPTSAFYQHGTAPSTQVADYSQLQMAKMGTAAFGNKMTVVPHHYQAQQHRHQIMPNQENQFTSDPSPGDLDSQWVDQFYNYTVQFVKQLNVDRMRLLNQRYPGTFDRVTKAFSLMEKMDQVLPEEIDDDGNSSFCAPSPSSRGRGLGHNHHNKGSRQSHSAGDNFPKQSRLTIGRSLGGSKTNSRMDLDSLSSHHSSKTSIASSAHEQQQKQRDVDLGLINHFDGITTYEGRMSKINELIKTSGGEHYGKKPSSLDKTLKRAQVRQRVKLECYGSLKKANNNQQRKMGNKGNMEEKESDLDDEQEEHEDDFEEE